MSDMWLPPGVGGGIASQGPATDSHNDPVIDPTKNVLQLVDAAVTRINDLMDLTRYYNVEIRRLESEHVKELRILEAQRIDAIRAVDVAASQQATKDAEVRASALAKQVSDAAEQQRNQVAAAAQAAATSLAAALVPIQERLAELTRLQYEQQGQKAQVIETRAADADFAPLISAVAALERTKATAEGQTIQTHEVQKSRASTAVWVAIGVSIFAFGFTTVLTIIGLIMLYVTKK